MAGHGRHRFGHAPAAAGQRAEFLVNPADQLGRGVGEVLAELTTLELDGRVVRRPGGLYGLP